ncbi:sensor histidine kinase KdpD [Daejeonella sp.]|uniref:sensor histidine kinase n=1 Tax=Daejeonella sp. TaxID=2805397 RepID=UPI002731BA62|nr:HAMP domain-containing sensor histidine kinase [Daejeonella sp.]MDP2413343.1 HAMP domain-containing sensor histidine kinase [Daejeonella sp.]
MKSKSISLIIGLMTIALLGVMGMQWYFFRQSYQLQSRLFDQSVHEALNNVVERLAKRDANNFLEKKAEFISLPEPPIIERAPVFVAAPEKPVRIKRRRPRMSDENYMLVQQRKADSIFMIRDSLLRARYPNMVSFNDAVTASELKDLEYNFRVDVYQVEDAFGQIHEQTRRTISRAPKAYPQINAAISGSAPGLLPDSVTQYIVFDPIEGAFLRTIPRPRLRNIPRPPDVNEAEQDNRVQKVKQYFAEENQKKADVFKDLYQEYREVDVPLNKRVHPQTLDSMLRAELRNLSILSNYEYKVTSAERDSLIFTRASNQTKFLPYNSYETPLFPKDMIRDSGMLTITFPDKNSIILSNMTAMMGLSGGLLLILIFSFGYTIHSILMQKKISEMKTDFINNMTHEFKTPVATIMIASEALKDPELTIDKSRIERLANIIYDENVRLGSHIERVLNIAKIEKGDLKLEHRDVDMNDLLSAIVDSMSLQLQKRNASIELDLKAGYSTVTGDELHLSNVIFNLLDNANKYSPENPQIKISTFISGKNLIIKVADKGIGMSKDQLSKIFDQFYRIPTGNLHDVKGFGLGLSYVNNIVKRLNGTIRVKSEKDVGSEFEISLPLKPVA